MKKKDKKGEYLINYYNNLDDLKYLKKIMILLKILILILLKIWHLLKQLLNLKYKNYRLFFLQTIISLNN